MVEDAGIGRTHYEPPVRRTTKPACRTRMGPRLPPQPYSGRRRRASPCSAKPYYGSPYMQSETPRPPDSPSSGPTMTWRRIWKLSSGPPRGRTGQWSSGPTSWHRFFTGPAQQASQDLPAETARPYPALKQAILAYYGHNLAARAQRFHDWRFDVRGVVQK